MLPIQKIPYYVLESSILSGLGLCTLRYMHALLKSLIHFEFQKLSMKKIKSKLLKKINHSLIFREPC